MESVALTPRVRLIVHRLWEVLRSRRWQWTLGVIFFLAINGYIGYRLYQDREQIAQLSNIRIESVWLVIAFGVQTAGMLNAVDAWSTIFRHLGYNLPLRIHFRIYALSNLAARLPGIGVTAASRAFLYGQRGVDGIQVAAIALMEPPVFGVAAIVVALAMLAFPGSIGSFVNPWVLIGAFGITLIILPSPLFRRLLDWLIARHPGSATLQWQHVLIWAGRNILTIVLGGIALYCVCRAASAIPESALALLIQCWALLVVAGSLLFWIPVELGITSSILVLTLAMMMPMPQALLLLIAWRVWGMLVDLVWGTAGLAL
ncbi:hypothetical protein [Roseiflexus castenholzii]|uniref:Uncharacterized protein n=1 Tax=Roseiflexus castenholzii (strain DSM 13941 / HLO8) TaxID=383372 RepID=A7NFP9_ROSCS|nr:hypothetical protein [Roseiflexus castenholzii]ABU56275.1 hypothetical protein Rcas_0140 [Roseiflexus castenholzii DSM 13941]